MRPFMGIVSLRKTSAMAGSTARTAANPRADIARFTERSPSLRLGELASDLEDGVW